MQRIIGESRSKLKPLFQDRVIGRTFVDLVIEAGKGHAFADDEEEPRVAVLFFSGLVIYAGDTHDPLAREAARCFAVQPLIMANEDWLSFLRQTGFREISENRRFYHPMESHDLNRANISGWQVPDGYDIRPITAADVDELRDRLGWEHPIHHFDSPECFEREGVGFCARKDGSVCAAISAFARFGDSVETQVTTHPDHRSRGLAKALGVRYLKECRSLGLHVPWDAVDERSSALARKLGYGWRVEYPVFSGIV